MYPTPALLLSPVATLHSSFFSSFNNCVAVYPARSEGRTRQGSVILYYDQMFNTQCSIFNLVLLSSKNEN